MKLVSKMILMQEIADKMNKEGIGQLEFSFVRNLSSFPRFNELDKRFKGYVVRIACEIYDKDDEDSNDISKISKYIIDDLDFLLEHKKDKWQVVSSRAVYRFFDLSR